MVTDGNLVGFLHRARQNSGFVWYPRSVDYDPQVLEEVYLELANRGLVVLKGRRPQATPAGLELIEAWPIGRLDESATEIGMAIRDVPITLDLPKWQIKGWQMTWAQIYWAFEALCWYLIPLGIVGLIIWGLVWVFRMLMGWG